MSDRDDDPLALRGDGAEREARELRAEVARLRRALARLVSELESVGALPVEATRALARELRAPDHVSVAELGSVLGAPPDDDDAQAPLVASPYRGAAPGGGQGCAACGAPFDDGDPELTLGAGSRVCLACYQRA